MGPVIKRKDAPLNYHLIKSANKVSLYPISRVYRTHWSSAARGILLFAPCIFRPGWPRAAGFVRGIHNVARAHATRSRFDVYNLCDCGVPSSHAYFPFAITSLRAIFGFDTRPHNETTRELRVWEGGDPPPPLFPSPPLPRWTERGDDHPAVCEFNLCNLLCRGERLRFGDGI